MLSRTAQLLFILTTTLLFLACEQQDSPSDKQIAVNFVFQWPTDKRPQPDSLYLNIYRPYDNFSLEYLTPATGLWSQQVAEGRYRITAHTSVLPTQPLYYGESIVLIEEQQENIPTVTIPLSCISQHLSIDFDLETHDEHIIIDSIQGKLTGLCKQMDVSTKTVPIEATANARVRPQRIASDRQKSTYRISLDILGLVCPSTPQLAVGPGLLGLMVYTHNDKEVKVFSHQVNLYDLLNTTPSLTYDGILSAYTLATDTLTLRLNSLPAISYEQEESSQDTWLDSTGIEIEI